MTTFLFTSAAFDLVNQSRDQIFCVDAKRLNSFNDSLADRFINLELSYSNSPELKSFKTDLRIESTEASPTSGNDQHDSGLAMELDFEIDVRWI